MLSDCKELIELKKNLAQFVNERDWHRFHTPKNLIMALGIETSELAEHFVYRSDEEIMEKMEHDEAFSQNVHDEMADVFNYLLHLSMLLEVDLVEAAQAKIKKNEEKHPTETPTSTQ